jgi:cyclophilin family peptidyl-prolyl cis-trans isomerase
MTKPTLLVLALAALVAAPRASAQTTPAAPAAPAEKPAAAAKPGLFAEFRTSRGVIGVRLLKDKAPNTVKNFVELAQGKKAWKDPTNGKQVQKPLYDGTLFHRVIPSFMIQGGDPLTQGAPLGQTTTADGRPFGIGDPGFRFADEIGPDNAFSRPGLLAMANSGPNTNGSQFFITEVPTPHLNRGHTIFGEVICGNDLVAKIARSGNAQTKLEKVSIVNQAPTCQ